MERKIRVCLLGFGRTGKEIASILMEQQDIDLVAVFCSKGSSKEGKDVGELLNLRDTGIIIQGSDKLESVLNTTKIDVAIDFTRPEATLLNCVSLAKHKVRVVVGTTGFGEIQKQKLKAIPNRYKTGIVYAPNITMGANVLAMLSNLAASFLEGYDCTIVESHFKGKLDAPSGTAEKITDEIYKGIAYHTSEGNVEEISVHSIRAGGIIGTHKVILAGEYDKIELLHESFSRKAFATSAVRVVHLIYNRVGYFEMQDILNMKQIMQNYIRRSDIENTSKKNTQIVK